MLCDLYSKYNEIKSSTKTAIKLNKNFNKVLSEENPYDFSFDRIYGPETSQREVFQYSAKNVIECITFSS